MDGTRAPLWELNHISKAFPGVQALENVSFSVFPGEVHALLGENGSGKSTLAKCLSGVHAPDSGQMVYRDRPVVFHNPIEARQSGVATIYQEFSLVPSLTVAENIFLGRYPRSTTGLIDWATMRKNAVSVLDQLSLKIDPEAVVKTLSVAEQQLTEIAKAISMDSTLLIMDEPTAALGLVETQTLMEIIRKLTTQEKAIIYISHRLDEVFQIADRVTILKDGKWVATAPVSSLKMGDVVRHMIGFEIDQHYPKEHNAQAVSGLEVENLSTENGVNGVTFSVRVGEVFGLGGMLGSGRTEIARAIYGIDHIQKGKIRLQGREVHFGSPADAIDAGVGLIPENRKVDGCFFNFEAPKNITISRLRSILQGGFLSLKKEDKVGRNYVQKMNIHPAALEKSVQFLSGGNQQKVIIARWLFSQARLLILDEPTQGIDIGAKLEVYKVINELTANGISVILISSDFPELLAISDRVAVIRDGQVVYIAESSRLTEFQLIGMASGLGLSEQIDDWMQLRKLASPHLKKLRDRVKTATHLAVLDRQEMVLFYLEKVGTESTMSVISRSGASDPLHCTGLGKALLAYEPAETIVEWVDRVGLPSFTEHTITDPAALIHELDQIRQQGYSLDLEEHALGVRSIAVPVFDPEGNMIAAVSVSGPAKSMPADLGSSQLRQDIVETACAITGELELIRANAS